MSRLPRGLRGGRLLIGGVLAAGLLLLTGRLASTLYVEVLWQNEAGYAEVFWTRVVWEWGTRLVAGLLVGGLIYFNLRVVSSTLGGIQIKRRFGNLEISEQLPRSYVFWGMIGLSALLALWFGAAVSPFVGTRLLLLTHDARWGLVDPILGRDVSFYVFALPLLGSVVTFALIVTFLAFTLVVAGYAATGALRWGGGRLVAQDLPRLHLGILIGAFLVLLGVRVWIGRYFLLLTGTSGVQGIVGFTDAEARLPALQTLTVICIVSGGLAAWGAWKNRAGTVVGALVAVLGGALVIGQFYPALVQRFQVEPNELARESPYIEHNLRFTRLGLGLDDLQRRPFAYAVEEEPDWDRAVRQFQGLPVWSREALLATYREEHARYPYYDFGDVTIDRYESPSGPVPVAVSVREVDATGIQDPNWQNLHLREVYIAGMGVVASAASAKTREGRPPMMISQIPPVRTAGAAVPPLERPQIYYGDLPQQYAVINGGPEQFLSPQGTPGRAGHDFPHGILLSSGLRTLALAWRFRDANLLFATEIDATSRFVFRRRLGERVAAIAPFLRFPEPPYPVLADGRVVWILEGYTTTRAFPLASAHTFPSPASLTYVRNSVKVTVDAVTGRVDFYRVPVDDPLADTYGRAFPGLFQPIVEMPEELRRHLRYPRALLDVQAGALLQYHQETAADFHGQRDVWELSTELAQRTEQVRYEPEYGYYALPGEAEARFNLTTVFVPADRQNLTGLLAGRTDAEGVPELVLFEVQAEDQVPGPRLIERLVEQDPAISEQLTLWRAGGSEVWMGHLHLVPAGPRLLYMEPVFLAAQGEAIPELQRFVVSDGMRVVMTEELSAAVAQLAGEDRPAPSTQAPETAAPPVTDGWPASALDLLERAEERLRAGDWAGFGAALEELRTLLRALGGAPPTG